MKMTSDLTILINKIVNNIDPEKIILFGSRARGDNHNQSDYDLCVLKSNVKQRRKLAQQIYRLLYDTAIAVDLIVETPQHFDELKENCYMIYRDIARNGKVVYDKSVSG
jgi:predicted nucleotidyltransferase